MAQRTHSAQLSQHWTEKYCQCDLGIVLALPMLEYGVVARVEGSHRAVPSVIVTANAATEDMLSKHESQTVGHSLLVGAPKAD